MGACDVEDVEYEERWWVAGGWLVRMGLNSARQYGAHSGRLGCDDLEPAKYMVMALPTVHEMA